MRKQIQMSANNWIEKFSDDKFAILTACILSTAPNSHGLEISEDVLRHDAETILGGFLVGDITGSDFGNHTPREKILGYAPKEQEIRFEENSSGYLEAYVDFVMSKQYSIDALKLFSDNNVRATSVEMMVETDDDNEYIVKSIDIFGLTVLGCDVRPSCSDAFAKVTRFSVDAAEEYILWNKQYSLWSSAQAGGNTAETANIANHTQEGEIPMVNEFENTAPVEETEVAEEEDMACGGQPEDMACNRIRCEDAEEPAEVEDSEKEPETEEDMACKVDAACGGQTEDMACGRIRCADDAEAETDDTVDERMAELEAQLEAKDNMISEMQAELEELRAFKEAADQAANEEAVDEVLKEVADALDEEQLAECRQEAMAAGPANFEAWANATKAKAFSAGATKKTAAVKQSLWGTTFHFATPNNFNTQSRGLWD